MQALNRKIYQIQIKLLAILRHGAKRLYALLGAGFFVPTIIAISTTSTFLHAHSEAEKARFVASNGEDTGLCNNRFRPCLSIAYAASQANKGDKILVAGGAYTIDNAETLVYLISDLQPVYAGYSRIDNYQSQNPNKFVTSISGVPNEYAQTLYERGFQVIQDTKGLSHDNGVIVSSKLKAVRRMQSVQTASNCIDGSAAGFSCNNIALLGRLTLSELPTSSGAANDIWGHVDLNDMREYAIIGLQRGVAVVDVTNPESPQVVGAINGQATTWRDIKVLQYFDTDLQRFKAYAYSGGDSVTEGLSVIDLSGLPNSINLVTRTNDDPSSHNVYISGVDYTTNTALQGQSPLLHITGSRNFGGAWRSFSLTEPNAPQPTYSNTSAVRADYTHDASSLLITDERVQRDCEVNNATTCNLILDFNEEEVRLWQHNSNDGASELSSVTYPNLQYVHSGWWSENKQYIFVHDELDERNRGINTTLNIFDISDLRQPLLVASWVGPTRAVDHNGFVKGNKYYMSNYERGVTVLDISDATSPQQIGFFDTFGTSDNPSFNGVWGIYPYLPSGNILASDIQGGLYILRDDSLNATSNAVGFAQTRIQVQENSTLQLEVSKQGTGSQSVDYELLYPSASTQDIVAQQGTLTWSANDTSSQFISIDISNDNIDEPTELFVVTLNNANNGDIINAKSHAFVSIQGSQNNSGQITFANTQASALETQGNVDVLVNRIGGSTGVVSVNYNVEGLEADNESDFRLSSPNVGSTSGELTWADGDTTSQTISISIINDTVDESNESFNLVLNADDNSILGAIQTLNVLIRDDESNQAPVVDAGADIQVNARQSVSLSNASATDEDAELSLSWSQTSGPSVTISSPNTLQASFVAPNSAGTIVLQLQASDDFGVTSTDSISIQVIEPAPVVRPPAAQTSSGGGSIAIISLLGLCFMSIWRRASRDRQAFFTA
jgi:choice-of-anchor B domain-containing protein